MKVVKSDSVFAPHAPFKDKSFQCVVTSSPYWFQRCYDPSGNSLGREFGLEPLPDYIKRWCDVTRQIHAALADNGLLFWNNAETASGSGGAGGDHYNPDGSKRHIAKYSQPSGWSGLPAKQDCNVPARLAIAMQDMVDDDGQPMWLQRKEIIWDKGRLENCDGNHIRRPKRQTERIYMFCKAGIKSVKDYKFYPERLEFPGDIWTFAPNNTGTKGSAPFPDRFAELCILPSTDPGDRVWDPFSGSGTTVKVADRLGRVGFGSELFI